MNKILKKKGFTLIELVVAMGILTMVFAGTVTLIVTVVNLAMSTRTKTEVVALAQKELTNEIVLFREDPYQIAHCSPINVGGIDVIKCLDAPSLSDLGDGFDTSNYAKITVTVYWSDRGGGPQQTYTLVQTVKRNP